MEVRLTQMEDVATYVAFGRDAQAWLQSRGLGQYVPAAHVEYAASIRTRAQSGILYTVWSEGAAVGFFSLDPTPSSWWMNDAAPALYLAGMVVARTARGRGVGDEIIQWCVAEAVRQNRPVVRIDCYADNVWLCQYYESRGFQLRGRVEQHPGYIGCLYERRIVHEAHQT